MILLCAMQPTNRVSYRHKADGQGVSYRQLVPVLYRHKADGQGVSYRQLAGSLTGLIQAKESHRQLYTALRCRGRFWVPRDPNTPPIELSIALGGAAGPVLLGGSAPFPFDVLE